MYLEQILERFQENTCFSTGLDSAGWSSKDGVYWHPRKLRDSLLVWGVHFGKHSLRASSTPLAKLELDWAPLAVPQHPVHKLSVFPSFCCFLNAVLPVDLLQTVVQLLWSALFSSDCSPGLSQLLVAGSLQFQNVSFSFENTKKFIKLKLFRSWIFFVNSQWRSKAPKPQAYTVTVNVKGSSGSVRETRVEGRKIIKTIKF